MTRTKTTLIQARLALASLDISYSFLMFIYDPISQLVKIPTSVYLIRVDIVA